MICHRCGAILPDNSIRCSNCGIMVNMLCPECKTVVHFGEKYCSHCGFELLTICPNCNSANLFSAEECRKCHFPLSQIKKEKDVSAETKEKQFNVTPTVETQYTNIPSENNDAPQLTYKEVTIVNSQIDNSLNEIEKEKDLKKEDLDFETLIKNIEEKDSDKDNGTNKKIIKKDNPVKKIKNKENKVSDENDKYHQIKEEKQKETKRIEKKDIKEYRNDIPVIKKGKIEIIQDKFSQDKPIPNLQFDGEFKKYKEVKLIEEAEPSPDLILVDEFQEYTEPETNQSKNIPEETNIPEYIEDYPDEPNIQDYTENKELQEFTTKKTSSEAIKIEPPLENQNIGTINEHDNVSAANNIQETTEYQSSQNSVEKISLDESPKKIIKSENNNEIEQKNTNTSKIEEEIVSGNIKENSQVSQFELKKDKKPVQKKLIPDKYTKELINKNAIEAVLTQIKKSIKKHIIAITGPEGSGKSAVVRQVKEILSLERYMTLYGSCSPLSQITSYGFFQDAFLRLLGFPPYRNNLDAFMRDFNKSPLKKAFNFFKPQELSLFLNFLYSTEEDRFENILENKQLMFSVLEKILKAFLTNTNMVIIIDNFDLLDGASYDFINYIFGKNFFNNRLKLLVAYQEDKPIQSFFDKVKYDIFETIRLNKFTDEELKNILKITIGIDIKEIEPNTYLDDVIARADGNAIRLEQDVALLFDINNLYLSGDKILIHPENKPEHPLTSLEDLIKFRVNFMLAPVKNILFMAAILGYRFATDVIYQAATIDRNDTTAILNLLRNELFIVNVDDFTCEFKNLAIWKLIYKEAQNDLLFKENSERLYEVLKSRVLSSNIQKLISCSEALSKQEEFAIWQETSSITAKLGDTNLFVIAQKQCLKILEEIDMPNADNVRTIIYEQIGKLLSKRSPAEALNYLSNVLENKIKGNVTNKIIDISGYFINSCYLTGNYFGVVEAVDAMVKNLQSTGVDFSTQIALIKTRQLDALINIGNTEQLITLIRENLLIKLNQELTSKQLDTSYKNLLMDTWFNTNIALAKAYALQGNIEVFTTTQYIKEVMENNKIQDILLDNKIALIEALAHSLVGETLISQEILTKIKNNTEKTILDKKLLCEWNLINIINRVYEHKLDEIKTDLFELAEFANNINEHATKHLIKLILGYVFKEEGDAVKAMSIYNEEITYFAKEKMAIGAMLAWALIAKASIDTGSFDMALTTATKAFDVSQSPKINNSFFGIYFQKLIAEIYLLKNDLLAVKMYLEKALTLAEANNIKFLLALIYIDYGKYMEEYMKSKQAYDKEQVKQTFEYYEKAFNIARELGNKSIKEKAAKARISFKTFCQLSGINLS